MSVDPLSALWLAIGGSADEAGRAQITAPPAGALPSSFAVAEMAAGAFAALGLAAAEWHRAAGPVAVDGAGACLAVRSEQALRLDGEPPGPVWDPLSRCYQAADGWVRLHGNYAQHRAAIAKVFGSEDPDQVAAAIAQAESTAVEAALHRAGGAAAAARTEAAWAEHPHGRTVRDRPLVETLVRADRGPEAGAHRPLRVLELTRVIAGPTAGRALAWFGAEVLRIEAGDHEELPIVVADFGAGKRSTRLDLRSADGKRTFLDLLAGTDLFLHGLRPGALERLGLGAEARAAVRPGLIDVSLSAYGTTGAWGGRRGFDSLMQLSTGLAVSEALACGARAEGGLPEPRALPCQILDHATGILVAAASLRAAHAQRIDGRGRTLIASLARTALALADAPRTTLALGAAAPPAAAGTVELQGALGTTHHAPIPVRIDGVPGGWTLAPPAVGADAPRWLSAGA